MWDDLKGPNDEGGDDVMERHGLGEVIATLLGSTTAIPFVDTCVLFCVMRYTIFMA